MNTEEAFDVLDENLKLDPDERLEAQAVHNSITALLQTAGIVDTAFLQGSFARKTMIAPLRDVDKVLVLNSSMAGLTPDQAMDWIQTAIAKRYPGVTFNRSRHALQVDFGPSSFYFDIVPAWETDSDDDDVLIANRETGRWDRSNTRELIRVVADRNGQTEGIFIHQVRMAKQVVKQILDGLVPGLHVESWAFSEVEGQLQHDEALARILEGGHRLLGQRYTEPTGVDVISDRLKPDLIATASPVLAQAARCARQARSLSKSGDHNEAIRIWNRLIGDCFPEADSQSDLSAFQRSFHGGTVTSSGTVSRTAVSGQTSRPSRSWRNE